MNDKKRDSIWSKPVDNVNFFINWRGVNSVQTSQWSFDRNFASAGRVTLRSQTNA